MDDELIIYRKHAGQEFMERARYNVLDLINNDRLYFNDYVPSQNDWIEKVVNLGSSAGQESLILKFEFTGKGYLSNDTLIPTNLGGDYISNNIGGDWLYIDNVELATWKILKIELFQMKMKRIKKATQFSIYMVENIL